MRTRRDRIIAEARKLAASDAPPPSPDELASAKADAERYKADYIAACELVAKMHAAAIGEVRGPIRGVVEDVEDLRARYLRLSEVLARRNEREGED